MKTEKEVSLKEILSGIFIAFSFYIIIAVINISNEDLYNWDIKVIFSEGGLWNISALLLFYVWGLATAIWLLFTIFRIIKAFIK